MGKFADIAQVERGNLARERGVKFKTARGVECSCDLRVITAADDDHCLAAARQHCNDINDPRYTFALACEVVALAAVDSASPDEKPEPYFASVIQIREHLDRDRVMWLHARQNALQSSVNPLRTRLTDAEYVRAVADLAEGRETDPFLHWAPSCAIDFVRTMARQLHLSLLFRSDVTSTSSATASSSTQPSQPSSSPASSLPIEADEDS